MRLAFSASAEHALILLDGFPLVSSIRDKPQREVLPSNDPQMRKKLLDRLGVDRRRCVIRTIFPFWDCDTQYLAY